MIETRQQSSEYIKADRNVQGMQYPFLAKISFGENAMIRKYMTNLRKAEYWKAISQKWGQVDVCVPFFEASWNVSEIWYVYWAKCCW